MVAQTMSLPNVRKVFIPDPGYIMIEGDLERADAHIVAWEADDNELKDIFRSRLDVHRENAKAIFHTQNPSDEQRHKAKAGVHAINYIVSARTLAAHLNLVVKEAEDFKNRWLSAHPKIRAWHKKVERQLYQNKTVTNIWGFKRRYTERAYGLLPKAVGWIGQSTVAVTIDKALSAVDANLPRVQVLLQVHDSLLMQTKIEYFPDIMLPIARHMHVDIPYADPLSIPVTFAASETSWGDVKKIDVEKICGKTLG